ncbi:MAG TPA: pyridoxamine 5'-phosphate oxidase family protein [Chitinispirillaceae bacterium]|nr:pyridoxamine 5'-phosphate oxidase family protein [Chitinispirillaceae bacterium]
MNKHEIMGLIDTIIEDNRTAVLATVDQNGSPHIRWITPGCIQERAGTIFMISSRNFSKIGQIQNNPNAELMFQSRALDRIVNVKGKINLLNNPSIRAETLECIGRHLHTFWNLNQPDTDLLVLEMVIEQAVLYLPQKGSRITVDFSMEF